MSKAQIILMAIVGVLIMGIVIFSTGDKEEETPIVKSDSNISIFPTTDELYVEQPEKVKNNYYNDANYYDDSSLPAFSDVEIEDGLAETNSAFDDREEVRAEVPRPQALPQPVEETLEETIEETEEDPTISKYLGMVSIANSTGPRAKIDRELIQLNASSKNETTINVSEWKLRSAVSGKTKVIGKAEKLFISGSSDTKTSVKIAPKGKLYLISGHSPIGYAFTVNKCMGYLKQFNTFYPSISTKCPKPQDEILYYSKDPSIFIDNECMDFVEKIGTCKIPKYPLPSTLTQQCQVAIAEEIGYNICVNRHGGEEDFYHLDQRIYFKQGTKIWREEREIIELIDEDGLIVDFVEY